MRLSFLAVCAITRHASQRSVVIGRSAATVVDSSDGVGARDQDIRALGGSVQRRRKRDRGRGGGGGSVVAVADAGRGRGRARLRRRRRLGRRRPPRRLRLRQRLRRLGGRRRLALSNGAHNQTSVGLESRPQRVRYDLLVQLEFTLVLGSQILLGRLEPALRPHLNTA